MFKRNHSTMPKSQHTNISQADIASDETQSAMPVEAPAHHRERKDESGQEQGQTISIISNDLTILGKDLKIISKGSVQVDGEILGDISGIDVTVCKDGKVLGEVSGERVVIEGEVSGNIRAEQVMLRPDSHVEGVIHHRSLTIEDGAIFEGRSKRHENMSGVKQDHVKTGQAPVTLKPAG